MHIKKGLLELRGHDSPAAESRERQWQEHPNNVLKQSFQMKNYMYSHVASCGKTK